jgi:hypothetical protein
MLSHHIGISIGVMMLRGMSMFVVFGLLVLLVYIHGGDMCGGVVLRCFCSLACVTLSVKLLLEGAGSRRSEYAPWRRMLCSFCESDMIRKIPSDKLKTVQRDEKVRETEGGKDP